MSDFATARRNMVDGQLRPNRVTHPGVLEALGRLPREAFLPPERRAVAYLDDDIPLGGGRHLMEPMVLGRLVQAAQPRAGDVALVVGAGTGYGAAVLAGLVETVIALEDDARLAGLAAKALAGLGLDNVALVQGPPAAGWAKEGPYDVILIEGAIVSLPDAIAGQLAEGGRLVGVFAGEEGVAGQARILLRDGGVLSGRTLFDAGVPKLPGFDAPPRFAF